MKADAKQRLDQILGGYDEKLAETARVEAAKRAAQAAFPERFVTLKTQIIRPCIQEIADVLNERGHEAAVRDQEESSSSAEGVKSAAISLRVVPKPFAHGTRDANPVAIEISFSANRNERKVVVSCTNTMMNHLGRIGKRGEYEVDAVTAEVVAGQVIETLGEAFGTTR
jgi:hypothetical protein